MPPSLSPKASDPGPITKPQKAQSLLIDTYLKLIEGENRRLAAEERAIEEERLYLAELPDYIADLRRRMNGQPDPEILAILRAKLAEAQAELDCLEVRMVEREAAWPARKAQMMADITRFHEKLGQSSVEP